MIFWHTAGALFIFRAVFRDAKVDVRFLIAGALLPDVVDKTIGRVLFPDTFNSGRLFAHTLLFAALLMVIVLVFTKRGSRRRAWMALAIGVLSHLVLDGLWSEPEVLFWPAFGWEFPPGADDFWSGLLDRLLDEPWRIAQELLGLSYLIYLWRKTGLSDPERRRVLLTTGRLQG